MPYKDELKRREAGKERQRKHRQGVTEGGVTRQGVTDPMLYPDGTRALLFPPSKFLGPEEDKKVQENVRNTMKGMSGSRLAQFRGLSNTFMPNREKDPSLKIPYDSLLT